jgi:hypothetical protein
MDWRQLIIDHPALAMASVLPLFTFAAAVKIGITLWNPGQAPPKSGQDGSGPVEPPAVD